MNLMESETLLVDLVEAEELLEGSNEADLLVEPDFVVADRVVVDEILAHINMIDVINQDRILRRMKCPWTFNVKPVNGCSSTKRI